MGGVGLVHKLRRWVLSAVHQPERVQPRRSLYQQRAAADAAAGAGAVPVLERAPLRVAGLDSWCVRPTPGPYTPPTPPTRA